MKSQRQKTPNKIDHHPATSKQIEYAKTIGLSLIEGVTRSDAEALIGRYLDDDEAASEGLIGYAREKGMLCSDYIGNKQLHNLLFDNLGKEEQVAFFCFCVYKFHAQSAEENLLAHPLKNIFETFGEEYSKNVYFLASLEEYYGEELVSFGKAVKKLEGGKSKTIYGGSTLTRAYKVAYEYVKPYI